MPLIPEVDWRAMENRLVWSLMRLTELVGVVMLYVLFMLEWFPLILLELCKESNQVDTGCTGQKEE
jgi:hypothetical protein